MALFANGNTVECDLLIGADGIHSRVRSKLFDDAPPTYRGYAVWRGIAPISPASIPPNTAVEIHGRGKRFGIGPVGLGRVGWWAGANAANTSPRVEERRGDRKNWKQGESVTPNSSHNTQRELLRLFDGWYRPVLQLIEASPSTSILKTGAFDRRATRNWGSGNRSLLGDAIHPTTPNLGQGGCMAIEDAVILAKCIHKYGAHVEALRNYERLATSERQRLPDTQGITELLDSGETRSPQVYGTPCSRWFPRDLRTGSSKSCSTTTRVQLKFR